MGIFNNTDAQTGQVTQPQITRGGGSGGIFPGANNVDNTSGSGPAGGGSRAIIVENGGTVITADARSINFTGSGVDAAATGNDVTVTIGDTIYTGGAGIYINDRVISIAVGGVITAMLADGSVTNIKLQDGSVSTAKLVDNAVVGAKIANLAVGNTKLADNAVTEIKIVDGAVATAKLADGSVTNIKIADSAVDSDKLAPNAVTTVKIQDDAVTQAKMADDSVGTAQLIDLSVTTAALANDSVTTGKIAAGAVETTDLANAAVTGAKIANTTVANGNLVHDSIVINGITAELGGNIRIPTGTGPTPPTDQGKLTLSPSPTEIVFATTGTTNCIATVGVTSGYTIKANSTSVSVTDANNNAAVVVRQDDTEFTFSLPNNERGEAHLVVEGTVVRSSDDSEFVHSASAIIYIDQRWYASINANQPTDISQMTQQGVWQGSGTEVFTSTGVAASHAYIALPTRSGGYTFKSGELFLNNTSLGALNTSWTLYRIDDFINSGTGQTLTVRITEA